MSRRFVVVLDNGTKREQDAITQHFQAKKYNFWHWIEDCWLLADVPQGVTPYRLWQSIREEAQLGEARPILIVEADGPLGYYGVLPKSSWNWLSNNWGKIA